MNRPYRFFNPENSIIRAGNSIMKKFIIRPSAPMYQSGRIHMLPIERISAHV